MTFNDRSHGAGIRAEYCNYPIPCRKIAHHISRETADYFDRIEQTPLGIAALYVYLSAI
jgi:hypothetical protein